MTIFNAILCVVDIREDCTETIERAVTLAKNNQASLTVVDIVDRISTRISMPGRGPISIELQSAIEAVRVKELKTLVEPYRQQVTIKTELRNGTRFLEIIRQVLSGGHDLVIKAPQKPAWLDRLCGSDDMNLLRECPCPVWLVKPQAEKSCRRILAAVDVNDAYPPAELKTRQVLNQQVLEMAASLALSDFAELHIVAAWQAVGESSMRGALMHASEEEVTAYVEQERQYHETSLNKLISEIPRISGQATAEYLSPKIHLVKGWAHKEIPALANQLAIDLIVMGTVARTGIPGFIMGNTAETILNQIDCSVLAIKPPGFETPVRLEN